jgi:hypothetical protein
MAILLRLDPLALLVPLLDVVDGRWVVDERVKTPPRGGGKLSWNDVEQWDEKGQRVETKENGHLNICLLIKTEFCESIETSSSK